MSEGEIAIQSMIYNGVPVLEMIAGGRPVMRRLVDNYLNATHILSLAGLSKGQRTKALEMFVSNHKTFERVQGGYGKYQGTWLVFAFEKDNRPRIPAESAHILAKMYGIQDIILPLLEADENNIFQSPSKQKYNVKRRRTVKETDTHDLDLMMFDENISVAPAAEESGIHSQSISPRKSRSAHDSYITTRSLFSPITSEVKQKQTSSPIKRKQQEEIKFGVEKLQLKAVYKALSLEERQLKIITNVYVDASNEELQTLLDRDIDMQIDTLGHTSLHWAASLANHTKVEFLLSLNASPTHVNVNGESILMRIVGSTHAFYAKSFHELLDLLNAAVYIIDVSGQTLWHHIINSFSKLQCEEASCYYFDAFCDWIEGCEREEWRIMFLNAQDEDGNTALHLVYGMEGKNWLVEELLVQGADSRILNAQGKKPYEMGRGDVVIDQDINSADKVPVACPIMT